MQTFQILLNNRYTAATENLTSELSFDNGYYVYLNKNGGGLVSTSNVRWFLNEEKNKSLTADFFAFLTGNTTTSQALNIINSDKKLTDVFNDYYQRYVISGSQITNTITIQQNLTGATQGVAFNYSHYWYGYAPNKQLTGITQSINGAINLVTQAPIWSDFTTEESYYVPVYLERGTNQIAMNKPHFDEIISLLIGSGTTISFNPPTNTTTTGLGSGLGTSVNLGTGLNLVGPGVDLGIEIPINTSSSSGATSTPGGLDLGGLDLGGGTSVGTGGFGI